MTRTIELCVDFEGTDDNFRLNFDQHVMISVRPFENTPGKYISMSFDDFDKIVAELANFRKLNASISEAA